MKYWIMGILLSFSLVTYANDADQLTGCWRFVKAVSSQGIVDQTWGPHPIGYLIYTPEGVMSAQIMRQHRTSKNQSIDADFFAYSGHYEVSEKKHVVTHHVETAVFFDMIGQDYRRLYRFDGNYLYLTITESKKGQTFIWEKCVTMKKSLL